MSKTKHKPEEYKHIRAWGRELLSFDYYIEQQQEQAAEEGAPLDALYRRDDGTWRCASEWPEARRLEFERANNL